MNSKTRVWARSAVRCAILAVALIAFPHQAFAKKILIYSVLADWDWWSLAQLVQAAGHTVTLAHTAAWTNMTAADFAAFDAILFPDIGFLPYLGAANANKAVWSSAIRGNIVVIGTRELFPGYFGGQHLQLITNAINFAASGPGTGLYVSLSNYYSFNSPRALPSSSWASWETLPSKPASGPSVTRRPSLPRRIQRWPVLLMLASPTGSSAP